MPFCLYYCGVKKCAVKDKENKEREKREQNSGRAAEWRREELRDRANHSISGGSSSLAFLWHPLCCLGALKAMIDMSLALNYRKQMPLYLQY